MPVTRLSIGTILPEGAGHSTWMRSSIAVAHGATSFAHAR
jgi:hypothetical protein